MKFAVILTIFFFSAFNLVRAQTDFGVKGGVSLTIFNENQEQFGENPETEVGYFGGVFIDVEISEAFHIQPEVLYKGVGEFRFINAPIYAEYYVGRDFSLLVGPSLNYFFDFFTNSFKVRGDVSAAYHVTERVEVNLKYTLGFEELSPNVLFLGLGFSI